MDLQQPLSTTTSYKIASAAGTLNARVITPAVRSDLPPLVVLHGISRNAAELATLFRPEAERHGRLIVVPHFSQSRWPHFQRPSRAARPDRALLALLSHLKGADAAFSGRVDLMGHSGGAQLAHRFAMLYPQMIGKLHLVAAGWYCLPDDAMAYPYGLSRDGTQVGALWARRLATALPHYLALPVTVHVGTQDITRDDALRQAPALDVGQGMTRLARAQTYIARFANAAQAAGVQPRIALNLLDGIGHDVAAAITLAGLASAVTGPAPAPLGLVG